MSVICSKICPWIGSSEQKYLNADNLLNGHYIPNLEIYMNGTKFYTYFISSIFEYPLVNKIIIIQKKK